MMPKFLTIQQIEADGYKQIVWELKDTEPQKIEVWFKDALMGRKIMVKCPSCKRFFDAGTVSKDSMYVEDIICPFCECKSKFQIRK